jgi:hypothetical protein
MNQNLKYRFPRTRLYVSGGLHCTSVFSIQQRCAEHQSISFPWYRSVGFHCIWYPAASSGLPSTNRSQGNAVRFNRNAKDKEVLFNNLAFSPQETRYVMTRPELTVNSVECYSFFDILAGVQNKQKSGHIK